MNQLQEKFKELNEQEFLIFKRSKGLPTEFDTDMNDITREKIEIFAAIHKDLRNEKCYLGKINRYSEDVGKPYLMVYEEQRVFNFEYGFMIPCYDEKLVEMIKEREQAKYTGTADDYKRVTEIMDRIHEVGGFNLFWV